MLTMDPEVQEMPTGTSQKETSLETMDVDIKEETVIDDEQECGDVQHSPMTPVGMEF